MTYFDLAKTERQAHLDLTSECNERGGNSTNHKGVLAQYLGTEIFMGYKRLLCHACNNPKCSNPLHLYWGTPSENTADAKAIGSWASPWDRSVAKNGYDGACKKNARTPEQMARVGAGNKGKPKSEGHRRKISESLKKSKS